LTLLMKTSFLVILLSCCYFYTIGRSFKFPFLKETAEELSEKVVTGG